MNWDAIGAIAEVVGAAGVIITLLYLALQIRRSNQLANVESNRFAEQATDLPIMAIVQNPEVAKIFRVGLADRESLSSDDCLRFDMLMGKLIGSLVGSLTDKRLLGRNDELGGDYLESIRIFLLSPGGASWWSSYRSRWAKVNQLIVDEVIAPSD
jgi:hypothetical protein